MKKTLIALALTGAAVTGTANASTLAAGLSSATQDLTVGQFSASDTGTGLYLDWRGDGAKNFGYGLLWNSATTNGNVLEAYLQPKMQFNDNLGAFARIGYSLSGANSTATDANGSFAWGLGAEYKFNKELGVEATYDKLYSDSHWDMSAISVGVTYHY
jgi:hypothetical protein